MSAHLSLHTGLQGDRHQIDVEWFDHNNVRHTTRVEIEILSQDKPRTLAIKIDGKIAHLSVAGKPARFEPQIGEG